MGQWWYGSVINTIVIMEYIEIGECIWCNQTKPECSFNIQPHIIPRSLGGNIIGFDICDKCNRYFGTANPNSITKISIEACMKEILNIIRFLLDTKPKNNKSYKELKSVFFSYRHSESKICINRKFKLNKEFEQEFARKFRRAVYEMFLQVYHFYTKKGLENRFDAIRRFARYDQGNLPLYFIVNRGIYLISKEMKNPKISFTDKNLEQIDTYGFYTLYLFGYWFFLEVTPRANLCREVFFNKQKNEMHIGGFAFKEIIQLEYITQIDFTLRNLYQ